MKRNILALGLAAVLCLTLGGTAWAAGSDFVIEDGVLMEYKGSDTVITIPEGVTEIGDNAFAWGQTHSMAPYEAEEIILPKSLTKIGDHAFWGCVKLKAVDIPAGVAEIGPNAFASCRSLAEVTIPGTVKKVGHSAFMDCTALTSLTIESGVEELGNSAFGQCTALTEVVIPDSVTTLGPGLFYGCTSLRRAVLPDNPQVAERWKMGSTVNLFQECEALEEIVNSPFTYEEKNVETNRAIEGWVNPGAYVTAQSERIARLSNEICAGISGDYEKAHAIYRWVAGNIAYDYEYFYGRKEALATAPEEVLDAGMTVCTGYARLTQALLQAQGIPALHIRGISTNGLTDKNGSSGHAWNMAFAEGRWVILDSTWGRANTLDEATGELRDKGGEIVEQWFDPKELFFAQSHTARVTFSAQPEDIPSDWARERVWEAICGGLAPNDLQGAYRQDITREEFCRLMVALVEKATGRAVEAAQSPFTDTSHPAVGAARALGIVTGVSETSFNPGGSITRQEAAVMLARTGRMLGLASGTGESFADEGEFAPWAAEGIGYVSGLIDGNGERVMGGTGEGKFSPGGAYTREQAVVTALRLLECRGK